MKKTLIVIIILIILSSLVFAKLSDEALKDIEKLRMKHYGYTKDDISCLDSTDYMSVTSADFEYEWQSIWFEDGKLIVSTNKGKWYIEMKRMTE